jgi:hypothetical protein
LFFPHDREIKEMADLGGFDATQIEPQGDYTPIPAGDYKVVITKSEKKPTKAGNGAFLELELQLVDGALKGRTVKDRLNIWNPNQTAAEIASRQLSAICHATGVMQPRASEQLHGITMVAGVAVKERDDKPGTFTNEVKSYKKSTATPVVNSAQPVGAGAKADKAPWEQ